MRLSAQEIHEKLEELKQAILKDAEEPPLDIIMELVESTLVAIHDIAEFTSHIKYPNR